ncbi:MAG: hypothetical protein HZC48_11875 [Nitrospirae bacterium]|nr:hypothetical protein [Nitrospirota bacterium]
MKKAIVLIICILLMGINLPAEAGDFIVEGNVGIGTDTPGATLDVRGSAVFNEDGGDYDFRIAGDTDPNLFVVDAGLNALGFGQVADYSYGLTKFTFVSRDKYNAMTLDVGQSNPAGQANGMLFDIARTGSADVTNDTLGIKFRLNLMGSGNISGQLTPFLAMTNFSSAVAGTSTVNTIETSNFVARWRALNNSRTWNINSVASDYLSIGQDANTGIGGITFSDFRHFYAQDSAQGTFTQQTGLWIDKQTKGTTKYGIVLNGDGIGADLVLGASKETRLYGSSGNLIVNTSGKVGIGTTTTPTEKLEVNGGVKLNTAAVKPSCNSVSRGTLWFTQSSAGVKDSLEICAKDASDVYEWRTLF